ncbi:hypothetical protein Q7P35_003722 [Cladosporium inversicolor]
MVFTTTNLFKSIQCPEGERCKLTSCIYGHKPQPQPQAAETPASGVSIMTPSKMVPSLNGAHDPAQPSAEEEIEPATKRRRVTYESLAEKPPSRAEKIKADLEASRSTKRADVSPSHIKPVASGTNNVKTTPASLARPVSPPVAGGVKPPSKQTNAMPASVNVNTTSEAKKPAPAKKEALNPRLLTSAPESHAKRTIFLQHLHKDMYRLNSELKNSTQPIKDLPPDKLKLLALNDQEVIKLALDEEEKAARDQPKVYANVIKNRIAAYRKMKPDAFVDVVKTAFNKGAPKPVQVNQGKAIHTGLTPAEEVKVAHHLVVPDQNVLIPHGYVPTPPTAAQAEEAARAVEASMNYEECDRCTARFRVFPDRNDEGKLTTNGPCRHHPRKKVFPPKQKTDFYTGGNQPYYPCCQEQVGSPGCTTAEDHVFKTSSPARLAAVLPFITTPENPSPAKDRKGRVVGAVGFDCEMGYTAFGLELIRITAVSWPEHELLLDVLVRPRGTIIELNSRFSGVFPEHFANAVPYANWQPPSEAQDLSATPPPLPIVDNPQKARELLCSFLTPSTPLIGHAIENDLNATRLCHPNIIDTMLLYPHPRGLPFRHGLKMLTKKYLERDIQMGGDRGHDSLEDAVATGDLVRVRVARQWREMQSKGWKFENGELVGPQGMDVVAKSKKRTKRQAGLDGADEDDSEGLGGEGSSVEYLETK